MKFALTCLFLSVSICVNAQNFSNTGSGLNDLSRFMDDSSEEAELESAVAIDQSDPNDPFKNVTVSHATDVIELEGLPSVPVAAYITDRDGSQLATANVSRRQPTVSIKKIKPQLIFVTLVYQNFRKAFDLDLSEKEAVETENTEE